MACPMQTRMLLNISKYCYMDGALVLLNIPDNSEYFQIAEVCVSGFRSGLCLFFFDLLLSSFPKFCSPFAYIHIWYH